MTKKKRVLWLVFDVSNGDCMSMRREARNYVWAYNSRQAARERLWLHRNNPETHANLIGPFKFVQA
jgi:hypothetical protein